MIHKDPFNFDMVLRLIEKIQTKTGLSVGVSIVDKVYEIGKKMTNGFKESMKIVFDESVLLPRVEATR